MKHAAVIILMLLSAALPLGAQQNPFLSSEPPAEQEHVAPDSGNASSGAGIFYNSAPMQKIKSLQKTIQAEISGYIRDYKTGGGIGSIFSFMLFSFIYGLLHVLGPGHRKVFLFTYFISRPSRWRQGMLAGFMTAVLHAVSAIFFIGGLYLAASKALLTRFNNITPLIERISYGAIIVIGIYLLVTNVVSAAQTGHSRGPDGHSPDTMLFILASGMIPCPGAATIMIFSLAVGSAAVGVYAVAAMSLGMAVVLTFIPPAAILLQSRLEPLVSKWSPETGHRIHSGISIAGAAVLVLFGLFFII